MKKEFSRVFIKDASGDVLVIRDRADMWNLPGGKKEVGESNLACAIREVKEEIGLEVFDLEEIYKGDFIFDDIGWEGHFYFAHKASGLATLNEPDKIKGLQFISELGFINFSTSLSDMLQHLTENHILDDRKTDWT